MKKQFEVRYIVTEVASIPVYKIFSKTEAYKQAAKPGWGVVDWEGTGKDKALVCDEDSSADIYTKDGGYFGIYHYEEINRKDIPKQADAEAILISDSCGYTFWTKGQIRIFVTYEESGLVDTHRIEYGADAQPYDGETELTFEDLYESEGPEWDQSYQEDIPGTMEYRHKQEAASAAAEAQGTDGAAEAARPAWMDDRQYEDFQQACALIDTIKTAKDFYRVIGIVNDRFSLDVINAARECKQCYNSGQYEQPQEWTEAASAAAETQDAPSAGALVVLAAETIQDTGTAAEAASEGRETALGTPEKMAGTNTSVAADGQQATPWAREINLGKLYAVTRPKARGGLRAMKPEPP